MSEPLFDLAAGLARSHAALAQRDPRTSVRVVKADYSEFTGAGFTIDQFEAGTLTVSPVSDDPAFACLTRVFAPGTWLNATVYDEHGYPTFSFDAKEQ